VTKDFRSQQLENANLSAAKVASMENALLQKCATVKKATRKSTAFVSQSVRGKIEKRLRNSVTFQLFLSIHRGCLNGICISPEQCQCPGNGWSLDSTGSQCVASCDKTCLNGVCSG
jgi:hypothetical protein